MPSKNKPGCSCCSGPPFCCDDTSFAKPATIDVVLASIVDGTLGNTSCQTGRIPPVDCDEDWNVSKTLTKSGDCEWTLTDGVFSICAELAGFGCLPMTRYWRLTIINDDGTWKQRLDITVQGYNDPFWGPIEGAVITFEHNYATRPDCSAIDLDRSLALTNNTHQCCDFSGATCGTTI